MSYKLVFLHSFKRQFDKLPKTGKEQILKGLEKAAVDPLQAHGYMGNWRVIGDGEWGNTAWFT